MMGKILQSDYGVPPERVQDCVRMIGENGRFAELIRDIGGAPHVLFDVDILELPQVGDEDEPLTAEDPERLPDESRPPLSTPTPLAVLASDVVKPKPIFLGHGKNTAPLQKLQNLLTTFQIPHKITVAEANLGRPIPQKVKETMELCGSAILIFTRDEKFTDQNGVEVWRPSENVVYELGAASFAYGDPVVIFKEKGLSFPANFQSIGYIEFDVDTMESKTADLLKELIGFGLVRVSPV